MTLDWLLAVATFALVSCWTPGPNNTFLMASGLTHGFVRTLPAILGVSIGFAVMVVAVAFGISKIFQTLPGLYDALKIASVMYLLYLAWRIATADPRPSAASEARPVSFLEAAGFQWVNPKGWTMALGASAAFVVAEAPTASVLVIGLIFLVSGLSSSSSWAAGGRALRVLIGNPVAVRTINVVLALLLIASLWPIVKDWLPGAA